jgi:hypothetical protein
MSIYHIESSPSYEVACAIDREGSGVRIPKQEGDFDERVGERTVVR